MLPFPRLSGQMLPISYFVNHMHSIGSLKIQVTNLSARYGAIALTKHDIGGQLQELGFSCCDLILFLDDEQNKYTSIRVLGSTYVVSEIELVESPLGLEQYQQHERQKYEAGSSLPLVPLPILDIFLAHSDRYLLPRRPFQAKYRHPHASSTRTWGRLDPGECAQTWWLNFKFC